MKTLIMSLFSVGVLFLASTLPSAAATPQQQSCGLLKSLSSGNLKTQLNAFHKLIGHWNQNSIQNFQKNARTSLQNTKVIGADLYLIGNFGQNLQDHLIIVRNAPGGVGYIRVHYEWAPKEPRAEYVAFEDHFSVIIQKAFPQAPKKLSCG
ncbi:MAG: hypothetical protein ACR2OJ_01285 [Hyphomicrobiales bacterium]